MSHHNDSQLKTFSLPNNVIVCFASLSCKMRFNVCVPNSPCRVTFLFQCRQLYSPPRVSSAGSSAGLNLFSAGASCLWRRARASLLRQVRFRLASAARPVGLRTVFIGGTRPSMAQKRPLNIFPTLHMRSPYPRNDITQCLH